MVAAAPVAVAVEELGTVPICGASAVCEGSAPCRIGGAAPVVAPIEIVEGGAAALGVLPEIDASALAADVALARVPAFAAGVD